LGPQDPEKIPSFDVGREKGTFMEAKNTFLIRNISSNYATASTVVTVPRIFTRSSKYTVIILQSCMKLLRNQNSLNELQKVIASCEPQQISDRGKTIN